MRTHLFNVLFVIFSPALFATDGGVHTGNGGGLSEIRLNFTWMRLESIYSELLNHKGVSDQKTLKNFIQTLRRDRTAEQENLIFKSSSVAPDFFEVLSNSSLNLYKSFKTSPIIGSNIYINLDNLYIIEDENKRSFNYQESLFFLINILKTRYSENGEAFRKLKKEIKTFYALNVEKTSFKAYSRPDIGLSFMNLNRPYLKLFSEKSILDISKVFKSKFICPEGSPGSEFKVYALNSNRFYSLKVEEKTVKSLFDGIVEYRCSSKKMTGDFRIKIKYALESDGEISTTDWLRNKNIQNSNYS